MNPTFTLTWQPLPLEAIAAVDRVHLMAYDAPGRHSTSEFAAAEVEKLIGRGVAPSKIYLGLPFYGRGVHDRAKTLAYAEIVRRYEPAGDVDEVEGVYFNGIKTVERKTKTALAGGLAGVMVWELGQDAAGEHSLVRAIDRVKADAPTK